MVVDTTSPSTIWQPPPLLSNTPPTTTSKGPSPFSAQRSLTHARNRSTSLTFHPTVRASHQRNLSRSLSIIAPASTTAPHSHTYVPSQRASQPATLRQPVAPQPLVHPSDASPARTVSAAADVPAGSTAAGVSSKPAVAVQSSIHRASLTGFNGSSYKVLLVGAPHSGKTALMQRLIAQHFDDGYQPTQRIELALYLLRDEQFSSLELWDVPCSTHIDEVLQPLYMEGVHAAVIVADLTDLRSFVDIGRWMTLFTTASSTHSSHQQLPALLFPVLLLANKADSADRVLSDASVVEWAGRHGVTQSHVVSAKLGSGVDEAFRSLVPHIERFVPVAAAAHTAGGLDTTQRLLSLLQSGNGAAARRSPSHSPSPSHRPSASLTPTSRTRASSLHSLLSNLPPSVTPRMQPPSASPRAASGRSHGQSQSALAVQRLTAAAVTPYRSPGLSVSTLGGHHRESAREGLGSSRSGSGAEEKEWAVAERKQPYTAGGAFTIPVQSTKTFASMRAVQAAGDRGAVKQRSPLHTPSMKEVDLRF